MGTPILLKVLGGFALRTPAGDASKLPRKSRALLAFLALREGRPEPRDALAEMLWPDRGPEQGRHSLRQALLDLRARLAAPAALVAADGAIALAPAALACDAAEFLRLAAGTDPEGWRAAVGLHAGQLLHGFPPVSPEFDDWLASARTRCEEALLGALGRLADRALRTGDAEAALQAAERMFAIDPLREDVHRRLLEACAAAGRRGEALRRYESIADLLRRELDVAPAAATRALVRGLRDQAEPAPALPAQPAGGPPLVAVLPLQQFGEALAPSHLADGLVADIVCQLAGLCEIGVISHGSTLGLTDPRLDPRRVGRMLGARYVVRGALQRAGERLRLTTELADAGNGQVVWARRHDIGAHDIGGGLGFAEQDRVVAQVVHTLAPRVQEQELRRIRGKRPESLSIYEKVLLVREGLQMLQREPFLRARGLLDDIIAAEPDYAEAHALAADWHGLALAQGWAAERQQQIAAVERLAQRALALDPFNLRALVSYAHRRSLLHRDYDAAQAMFARALEVGPNAARALLFSSYTASYVGDAGEALRRAGRALELSPQDREAHEFYCALCVASYTGGDYRAAAEWGGKAVAETELRGAVYGWAAAALAALGRGAQARELAVKAMRLRPGLRVRDIVANHPYRDETRRKAYGAHLIEAGFPA